MDATSFEEEYSSLEVPFAIDDESFTCLAALPKRLWSLAGAMSPCRTFTPTEGYNEEELSALARELSKSAELLTTDLVDTYTGYLEWIFPDMASGWFRYNFEQIARTVLYFETEVLRARVHGSELHTTQIKEETLETIDWWVTCVKNSREAIDVDIDLSPAEKEPPAQKVARLDKDCQTAIDQGITNDRPLMKRLGCGSGTLRTLPSYVRLRNEQARKKDASELASLKRTPFTAQERRKIDRDDPLLNRLIDEATSITEVKEALCKAAKLLGYANA